MNGQLTHIEPVRKMIRHESRYLEFIKQRGVGANDMVASSPSSYVSYLRSVSRIINAEISPDILRRETDINGIKKELKGKRSAKTINNYCSAMRQYIAFVENDCL